MKHKQEVFAVNMGGSELASASGIFAALASGKTTNQIVVDCSWLVGGGRHFSISVRFQDGALTLAEHSHRAGPTAQARRTSWILDVPEADPEWMEVLVACPLRLRWKNKTRP